MRRRAARFGPAAHPLAAVTYVESAFPRVPEATKRANAVFTPAPWRRIRPLGGDINHSREAIQGAPGYFHANGGFALAGGITCKSLSADGTGLSRHGASRSIADDRGQALCTGPVPAHHRARGAAASLGFRPPSVEHPERNSRTVLVGRWHQKSPKEDVHMLKSRHLTIAAVVALIASLSVAQAASAGSRPRTAAATASCTVSGNVVQATGLPSDAVVNFMVSDGSDTYGWVLGYTPDGTWSVTVPDRTNPTTYEFASTTFGKDGSKYWVYASCSAS